MRSARSPRSTTVYDNRNDDSEDTPVGGPADGQLGGSPSGFGRGPASGREDGDETAGHGPGQAGSGEQDTSTPASDPAGKGVRPLTSTPRQRGLTIGMLARVRIATVTTGNRVGDGYVCRALRDLETLGFVGHGKSGRSNVYHLTAAGQRAVLESGEIPIRPNAATGEKAIAAGLAEHGLAVTETLVQWNAALMDWDVEVAHPVDKVRSVISDAVLYRPGRGAKVEFLEVDRFTMSMSRLVESCPRTCLVLPVRTATTSPSRPTSSTTFPASACPTLPSYAPAESSPRAGVGRPPGPGYWCGQRHRTPAPARRRASPAFSAPSGCSWAGLARRPAVLYSRQQR
ncbi:replication-relaxation family protein [Streptomyces sp. NPDC006339]|uniref:replication-relaxation family protein n=1 Tax=Streptomyces sp. NPDC006339 TaxID=3156755 RepID=UPI0033BCE02C